jgi:hypothetical protein
MSGFLLADTGAVHGEPVRSNVLDLQSDKVAPAQLGVDRKVEHRVPKPAPTPEFMQALETIRINPTGEFPEPLPIAQAAAAVAKLDGYAENETDRADTQRQWPQLKGQVLVDRAGVVRWRNIECAVKGPAGIGKLPSIDETLAAAEALPR